MIATNVTWEHPGTSQEPLPPSLSWYRPWRKLFPAWLTHHLAEVVTPVPVPVYRAESWVSTCDQAQSPHTHWHWGSVEWKWAHYRHIAASLCARIVQISVTSKWSSTGCGQGTRVSSHTTVHAIAGVMDQSQGGACILSSLSSHFLTTGWSQQTEIIFL